MPGGKRLVSVDKSRFVQHVGVSVDEAAPGRSRCSLRIQDFHRNPSGVAHGGAIFTLADTAMAAALMASLEEGLICTTVEIKLGYFRPVFDGQISCDAVVVNKGKTLASLEAGIVAAGKLVAKASGTFAIIPRKTEGGSTAAP